MKSETVEIYPQLQEHKEEGFVVLFTSNGVGTVINTGDSLVKLGQHCELFDMNEFEVYQDDIILKNSKE